MTPKQADNSPVYPSSVAVTLERLCWALAALVAVELLVLAMLHIGQRTEAHARRLGLPITTPASAEQLAEVTE